MYKPYKQGLLIGKFMPFHKGHELTIEFAMKLCEEVVVIVSGGDAIPLFTRVNWLRDHYRGTNVVVYCSESLEKIPDSPLDENGIATDPEFWNAWINEIEYQFAVDAVFTNDLYGKILAERLDAKWVPLDEKRSQYPISATMIRRSPTTFFNEMTKPAKRYYQQKIAIIGPESTGKSTMVETLAANFGGVAVNEYGRALAEIRNNNLSVADFDSILAGQELLVEDAAENSRLIISDTEAYTTYLYSQYYLEPNEDLQQRLYEAAIMQEFDSYILLAPTVEWTDDGTRTMPDQRLRKLFYADLQGFLLQYMIPERATGFIIEGDNWSDRINQAAAHVKYLLDNPGLPNRA